MSSPPPLRPTGGSYNRRRHGRPVGAGLRRRRCKMKLMYFLMDRDEQRGKRLELEFEVSQLETALDREQRLGRVLHCSLQGRVVCHCCLSALVPNKVRSLLGELAMVEDEIFYLEKKVDDLRLHREREWNDHCVAVQQPQQQRNWPPQDRQPPRHSSCGLGCRKELFKGAEQLPRLPCPPATHDHEALESECESKASVRCDEVEHGRRRSHCQSTPPANPTPAPPERKICCLNSPNKLSEELVRLTVTIFHKLSKAEQPGGGEPARLHISCIIGSRSLVPKAAATSRSSRSRTPKGGAGCQQRSRFVEFTRASVDVGRVSLCLVDIKNLRGLMQKLSAVDPSLLTNKQKLAFWINVYNFCVMHAFLQHGLPPSPDKLLALLNQKASVNVGGTVLNVVTIEHLILRHSSSRQDNKQRYSGTTLSSSLTEIASDDDGLLRSYGLGYPEPNAIFALCRGSRSSPALRVYTAEDVSNELERAKAEYLESWVRVAGRRQLAVLPRLLHRHMRHFADDAASLLEWVHTQLPRGPLKRAVREVLANKLVVEVEPYDADFCYMLPPVV